MANGAPYAVQIMSSESSNLAVEPEIPTSNTGSTFLGWYKADGTKWDFTRDVVNDHICVAARWDTAQQFSGVEVGKIYYFDLSGESIPGAVNANLPDTTLHYVPFTYVGTLDGYVLKPASGGVLDSSDKAANTTDSSASYGHAYLHSLFIADHILTTDVSYDMLNAADYIFGNSCTVNDVIILFVLLLSAIPTPLPHPKVYRRITSGIRSFLRIPVLLKICCLQRRHGRKSGHGDRIQTPAAV